MKALYLSIGKVYCPVLKKDIVFNAKGFHHLHYKPDGTARKIPEKIHKLLLMPLAVSVLRQATSIFKERNIEIRTNRKKGAKIVQGKQYALTALVGKKFISVRVIVLDIKNSLFPIFWSIMRHTKKHH